VHHSVCLCICLFVCHTFEKKIHCPHTCASSLACGFIYAFLCFSWTFFYAFYLQKASLCITRFVYLFVYLSVTLLKRKKIHCACGFLCYVYAILTLQVPHIQVRNAPSQLADRNVKFIHHDWRKFWNFETVLKCVNIINLSTMVGETF
jgi:hypothetical protein